MCWSAFAYLVQDRKSAALKKIIASMTVGKDVSELFPDVAKCISTEERGWRLEGFSEWPEQSSNVAFYISTMKSN